MRYGYIRISTKSQNPDRQIHALNARCDRLFEERFSAASVKNRDVFKEVLRLLNPGDVLVILDLDRAFRNAEEAIVTERVLREQRIIIEVVNCPIDTSTAEGNRDFQMRAVNAEYERRRISERTIQGLIATRAKGTRLGREPKMTTEQVIAAQQMIEAKEASVSEIAAANGVHPWTLTRNINRRCRRE